jgi:hypothetical protein
MTTFTTPWGTSMYDKMSFGLINSRVTFQRDMDIAFVGERYKFIIIYLDDMIVFSQTNEDYIKHLRKTFVKCRRFGLSLNPKMSYFSMEEGKILGISKEGVKTNSGRVEAIKQITLPRNNK